MPAKADETERRRRQHQSRREYGWGFLKIIKFMIIVT